MLKLLFCLTVFLNAHFSFGSVPLTNFFPYGSGNGDSSMPAADDTFVRIPISSEFKFFNNTYNTTFISTNGAITFESGVTEFTPNCNPMRSPMIAPFWADVNTQLGGSIFYRESRNHILLEKAGVEISRAFPSFWNIRVGWLFIVTWFQVPFYGADISGCPDGQGQGLRNTFQEILASDGVHSFAIFYYNNINWTTGTASDGDRCTGTGGTPAKAGFDVGDGSTFYKIPSSCTPEVINLDDTSNIDDPGKWIFRIDDVLISTDCDDNNEKLTKIDHFIPILGHTKIEFKGPCFENIQNISCHFQNKYENDAFEITDGRISVDFKSVSCPTPYMYKNGPIYLETRSIYLDGTELTHHSQLFSTDYKQELFFTLNQNGDLSLNWNKDLFTSNRVDLHFIPYNGEYWVDSDLLFRNIENRGSFNARLATELIKNVPLFYVLALKEENSNLSKFEILTAFSNFECPAKLRTSGENEEICNLWYENDEGVSLDGVEICPPTVALAQIDQRFQVEPYTVAELQYFHPGAQISYRQRTPSESGAGQQCVYRSGNLFVGPMSGGTVDRYSHNSIQGVLKHWQHDIVPWCSCCGHGSEDSCRKYYKKRPSNGGHDYEPPTPAPGTGDPHITTFDGISYTFNGVGEFWMIKTLDQKFQMQARLEQYINLEENRPTNASIFTTFAVKQEDLHVQIAASSRGIDYLIDGEIYKMPEGVAHLNLDGAEISQIMYNELSLSFSSGFSFVFSTPDNISLNIISLASPHQKGNILGLYGFFDRNPENDLKTHNGDIIPTDSNTEYIHYNFGLEWMILESESNFIYPIGFGYEDYKNTNFVPNFETPDLSQIPEQIREMCGESQDCLFDYMTSGSISLSNGTKKVFEELKEMIDIIEEPVLICPEIPELENGFYSVPNYQLGSTANFSCHEGFLLNGPKFLICQNIGEEVNWNEDFPTCFQNQTEFTCQGKINGNFRNLENCNWYWSCSNEIKTKNFCPTGLHWDWNFPEGNGELGQCNFQDFANCLAG